MVPCADTQVLLRIPATPVTAGGNVTLKCEEKGKGSQRATFYRNGFFYRTEPTGDMTIVDVSQSDEGVYKCEITYRGESPSSWLLVTGQNWCFVFFLLSKLHLLSESSSLQLHHWVWPSDPKCVLFWYFLTFT